MNPEVNTFWRQGEGKQQNPCVKTTGAYQEITAREFNDRKELVVIVLKAPEATGCFKGFRAVLSAPTPSDTDALLAGWPSGQPIGLICPDGDCSGRLAVRLSKKGHTIFHLSGGLSEWRDNYRC